MGMSGLCLGVSGWGLSVSGDELIPNLLVKMHIGHNSSAYAFLPVPSMPKTAYVWGCLDCAWGCLKGI